MEPYHATNPVHRKMLDEWYWNIRGPEFAGCFHPSIGTPEEFAKHFEGDTGLLFTAVNGKFVTCMWLTPWFDGVELGLWMDKHYRAKRSAVADVLDTISCTLTYKPFVLSCTIQPRVGKVLRHLGFVHIGDVPEAWDGKTVSVYRLTRETLREFQIERIEQ